MRVAVFSDVHGNIVALDAVLAAARDEGTDHFWCLGNLVAHGQENEVRRLRDLGLAPRRRSTAFGNCEVCGVCVATPTGTRSPATSAA